MKLCDYGCGQEATYQFKNGKWCCSKHHNQCTKLKNKISEETRKAVMGKLNPMFGKKHSKETKQKLREIQIGKTHSESTKRLLSMLNAGKNNTMFGRKHSEETKQKISKANKGKYQIGIPHSEETKRKLRLTIKKIQERYPFFYKLEEMRYNPDKSEEKEIQVRCKNHKCKNSKEKDGWFTPSRRELSDRIMALEKEYLNDGSYFYCCQECKDECPLYNLKSDPFKIINPDSWHTNKEYQIFRQEVLYRQKIDIGYNECEICETRTNLQIHHEKPQKSHSIMTLDPDNGLVLCIKCHYGHGHKNECSTGQLAKKNCK